jgi:hypothetical protein
VVIRFHAVLAKKYFTKMGHPPYAVGIGPSDVWLFPELKKFPEWTKIC